jgi:hypothetical protein
MRRVLLGLWLACAAGLAFGDDAGSITGRVTDETGATLAGAQVEVTNEAGKTRNTTTNDRGEYSVSGLLPGRYVVMVTKLRFMPHADGAVMVEAGKATALEAKLAVSLEEHVDVTDEVKGLSVDANANAGSLVFKGEQLEGLPDDPDELRRALEALAGPMAGPEGVSFEVDGFRGGVPPKAQIREIRFNRNPFAAEHDSQMSGGFEITTKGGTGKLAGNVGFGFNDEILNSRNPYAQNRPPYQRRSYSLDASGPLVANKLSFALNVSDNSIEENDLVSATVLDSQFQPVPMGVALVAGSNAVTVTPRLDWQMNKTHSLMLKYSFNDSDRTNAGVGGFSLPSRAYDSKAGNQTFQVVESGTFGQVASALRFQYTRRRNRLLGDVEAPGIEVLDAFTGGGSQVGRATSLRQTWELGEVASWAVGASHTLRVGGRIRGNRLDDISPQNFGGTVAFTGGFAPVLDARDEIVRDAAGNPVVDAITSLERYRRTLTFQQRGLSPDEIRRRGGGASQLRIAGGDPTLGVEQWDLGLFAQDDWRPATDVQLSLGLRYENQTNISSPLNFAPRGYVSWGPKPKGSKEPPKTVFSLGAGIFYDRVGEDLTLQARRFDGIRQQQYVIAAPEVLDRLQFSYEGVSGGLPSTEALTSFAVPQTRRRVSADIEAPYRLQVLATVERQIRKGLKATAILRRNQFYRMLRSESLLTDEGRVYEYQSTGIRRATWYTFSLEGKPIPQITVNLNFGGGRVGTNTDGPNGFPANPDDMASEWGPAFWDSRNGAWGMIEYKPRGWRFVAWAYGRTGGAFNITTGRDNNGDSVYSDRPGYATDPTKPGVVSTRYGLLDPNPEPGQPIIPRNLGRAPGEIFTDFSMSRSFGFGKARPAAAGNGSGGAPAASPASAPAAGGGPAKPAPPKPRYTFEVRAYVRNLWNSTNAAAPVGNIGSPLFGRATRGGGPRVVNLGATLSF